MNKLSMKAIPMAVTSGFTFCTPPICQWILWFSQEQWKNTLQY